MSFCVYLTLDKYCPEREVKSLDTEKTHALPHGDVCGYFIASDIAFSMDALICVTVLHEHLTG